MQRYFLGSPGRNAKYFVVIVACLFSGFSALLPSNACAQLPSRPVNAVPNTPGEDSGNGRATTNNESDKSDRRTSTIGLPGSLTGIVINGPLLKAKPIANREQPFFVRVIESYPHGDSFRYDLEYTGLEEGNYNILEYLEPATPGEQWDRSELRVTINALLPPDEIRPAPLDLGSSYFGHYYTAIFVAGGLLWFVGLLVILFWGRGKTFWPESIEKPKSLAETLRPLIEKANSGQLTTAEQATLERTLVAFWQRRLKLEHLDAHELRQHLRRHPEAGKMLEQVDSWLHDPSPAQVNVDEMLQPYQEVLAQGERG